MATTNRKCSMFGCGEASYRALAIAQATVVDLCLEHFVAEGGVVDEARRRRSGRIDFPDFLAPFL